jgi:hypothetical protein
MLAPFHRTKKLPAFAMTFNKLQGATMGSLVVVMTDLKGLMVGSHTAAKAGVAFIHTS